MQDNTAPVEIIAISRQMKLALGENDKLYEFASMHDEQGDEVDEIEDAVFATIDTGLRWQYVLFADFVDAAMVS